MEQRPSYDSTQRFRLLQDHHIREFLAGTVSGWVQVVVGHPLDTVKVRLQTQGTTPLFRGALDCVAKTTLNEGPQGLFKGMSSPLVGIGLCNAVLFSANENFRRILQHGDPSKELSLTEMTVAGGLSGVAIALVLCPIELVKIRMQVRYETAHGRNSGILACAQKIWQSEGLRHGLYRGLNITLLREIPSFAAYFGAYEALKQILSSRHPDNEQRPRTLDLLLAGGIAGQLAWVTCYPQDIIKSRIQADTRYKSMIHCTQVLWLEGNRNWRVFFRGFGTTMVRAFPANAATFFAYEKVMECMGEFQSTIPS